MASRFLRLKEVLHRTGLGKSTLYQLIQRGEFKCPAKQGRSSFWLEDEVEEWITIRAALRRNVPA